MARRLTDGLRALAYLARARLLLARLSTADLLALFRTPPDPGAPPAPPERVVRVGRAVAAAARWVPWRSDCLVQALAAGLWLSRLGVASELRLGARAGPTIPGERFGAHAWLVAGGRTVVGGPEAAAFTPFAPPAGPAGRAD